MATTDTAVSDDRPAKPTADPLVAALARYVLALDRRYPDGPAELTSRLDSRAPRANITRLRKPKEDTAA